MKSYKAEELFDENGRLIPELAELAPKGDRRMGANPHANGGLLLRDLRMPDFAFTRCMCLRPARWTARIRWCWASFCATWPS
jgi:phosphoketolase